LYIILNVTVTKNKYPTLDSIKGGEFLAELIEYQPFKKDSLPWTQLKASLNKSRIKTVQCRGEMFIALHEAGFGNRMYMDRRLFHPSLWYIYHVVSFTDYTASYGRMGGYWKEYGRKRSWPNRRTIIAFAWKAK
jgi:hypothetical protein